LSDALSNLKHMELERTAPRDRYADYCLWDYPPLASPAGKLRSANLLWRAIEASGGGPELVAACRALRATLGHGQTVFGVKQIAGRLSFEFYFYDYARLQRQVSITRVLSILAPWVRCPVTPLEQRPYFMFSIDLDQDIASGRRSLDTINVYIGNPGSTVSSGICYEQTTSGLRLANFYFFFDAKREMESISGKICCSAHHDMAGFPLSSVLRADLMNCAVVVVANKKFNDGIYFSRIPVDPLIGFLAQEGFPSDIVNFAQCHRNGLDHLLYDVGLDYTVDAGKLKITKSAFYGLL
jgi:hypothetical protein